MVFLLFLFLLQDTPPKYGVDGWAGPLDIQLALKDGRYVSTKGPYKVEEGKQRIQFRHAGTLEWVFININNIDVAQTKRLNPGFMDPNWQPHSDEVDLAETQTRRSVVPKDITVVMRNGRRIQTSGSYGLFGDELHVTMASNNERIVLNLDQVDMDETAKASPGFIDTRFKRSTGLSGKRAGERYQTYKDRMAGRGVDLPDLSQSEQREWENLQANQTDTTFITRAERSFWEEKTGSNTLFGEEPVSMVNEDFTYDDTGEPTGTWNPRDMERTQQEMEQFLAPLGIFVIIFYGLFIITGLVSLVTQFYIIYLGFSEGLPWGLWLLFIWASPTLLTGGSIMSVLAGGGETTYMVLFLGSIIASFLSLVSFAAFIFTCCHGARLKLFFLWFSPIIPITFAVIAGIVMAMVGL